MAVLRGVYSQHLVIERDAPMSPLIFFLHILNTQLFTATHIKPPFRSCWLILGQLKVMLAIVDFNMNPSVVALSYDSNYLVGGWPSCR